MGCEFVSQQMELCIFSVRSFGCALFNLGGRKNVQKTMLLLLAICLLANLTACNGKTNDAYETTGNSVTENNITDDSVTDNSATGNLTSENFITDVTPTVLTDLFSGERRIWFYIADDELAYDNDVKAVFITENNTVTALYYNLIGNMNGIGNSANMVGVIDLDEPNPFSCERLLLSDFSGLSDDEIIEKVSNFYADASLEYTFNYGSKEYVYKKCSFPYEILYDGDLDSSGNNLENEILKLFEHAYSIEFTFNRSGAYEMLRDEFYFDSLIKPTVIKDKEYVGIKGVKGSGGSIITINTYTAFDRINYDSPDGITKW